MNKFSLYDLLGLLFPGFILTWLLTTLSFFYHLSNHSVISNKLNSNNFLWNNTIELRLFNGQVIESQVNLKEIGKFRKLEHDSWI